MKTLHLHGHLKQKYGESFDLDVESAAEAVRALGVQLPGFERDVRAGNWHVIKGELDKQEGLDEEGVTMALGNTSEVHLLPAIEGAGGAGGILAIIGGAVLFAVGFWFANPYLMTAGVGLMTGGIVMMTTSMPAAKGLAEQERADDRTSFLFNGATNTSSQGAAVPRGYGRVRVGSIVVSAALYSEELAV